jgi:hypothetical protein
LKNKGFKEERMTKVGLYAIDKSTTLESNKSLFDNACLSGRFPHAGELAGLHPLQDVWSVSGYQVITPVACLGFLVGFLGVAPPRARVVLSGL